MLLSIYRLNSTFELWTTAITSACAGYVHTTAACWCQYEYVLTRTYVVSSARVRTVSPCILGDCGTYLRLCTRTRVRALAPSTTHPRRARELDGTSTSASAHLSSSRPEDRPSSFNTTHTRNPRTRSANPVSSNGPCCSRATCTHASHDPNRPQALEQRTRGSGRFARSEPPSSSGLRRRMHLAVSKP